MAFTNAEKSQHGVNAQNNLENILSYCVDKGYIATYTKNFRTGKDGYSNDEQFYAPFVIEFVDTEKWIIFSTTSMRTDRIKGQQWDAINLKEIDSSITKAYLVYSDSVSDHDKAEFERQHNKYISGYEFSAIDGVINQDALYNLIEATALSELNSGQIKDIQGRGFEDRVASILSSSENLVKWKTNAPTLVGYHYAMFESIVTKLDLSPETTANISATTSKAEIGRLPSGGNPKTDILIYAECEDITRIYGISCKRSSDASVSVHQYTANAFADVLNPEDVELRTLLNEFQKHGNLRDFGESNCSRLTEVLKPYRRRLAKWVLGGIFGDGDQEKQWATHILTYDNNDNSVSIHTIQEYVYLLDEANVQGHFGTFFNWTYPSKRRGLSIQLKCKIL